MLDWDDLRYFVALADHGSLSAAARALKVDHATVARRVAALEEKSGLRLFDRRARRYLLTGQGQRIAEHARRMEAEVFALERGLIEAAGEEPVEISVSAPPVLAASLIAPRLPAFYAAHAHIRLHLGAEARNVSLTRREADIAVRLSRPSDPQLVIRKAGQVCYRLYGAPAYLRSREPADYGFIAFDELLDDTPQQAWLKQMAAERAIVLRTNDLGLQCAAAAAGAGLAVLPDFAAAAAGLQAIGGDTDEVRRDAYITYHEDLRGSAPIAATVSFLAECVGTGSGRRPVE